MTKSVHVQIFMSIFAFLPRPTEVYRKKYLISNKLSRVNKRKINSVYENRKFINESNILNADKYPVFFLQ